MKKLIPIYLFITFLLISCIKPVEIIIPDSFRSIPSMPVTGADNSWKLDFGNYHVYNITDAQGGVLITDAKNLSYDIRAFEFYLNTAGNTQYRGYCEFPMKTLDDETFSCMFQNVYNQFDTAQLTSMMITSPSGEIKIDPYYEHAGKKEGSKNTIVGYMFTDAGNEIGLVDISNVNNETVWINPNIEMHKQLMIAAGSTSLILKQRKWYQAFYEKADQDATAQEDLSPF